VSPGSSPHEPRPASSPRAAAEPQRRRSRIGLGPGALAILVSLFAVLGGCAGSGEPGGAELYRMHCARCHGADGKGDPRSVGLYPALDLTASRLIRAGSATRGAIYLRIADGYDAMPGFSAKLDTPAIEALIDYILRLPQGKASG
jgi:mono/diheme cytochrome c family protein